MDDILTVKDPAGNTLESWESEFGVDEIPIPSAKRRAQLWKKMPSAFYNWIRKMTILRLNNIDNILRNYVLWEDVDEFIYMPEAPGERPPQEGVIRGQHGFLLRKVTPVDEPVYFAARARYDRGAVLLRLTAEGSTAGDAVLAVGLAESLSGPWTYYYGSSPWTFDPDQPLQEYVINTTELTVGKLYYYRLIRQRNDSGDTLNASVLLAGVQVR